MSKYQKRAAIIITAILNSYPALSFFFAYLFTAPAPENIGIVPKDFSFPAKDVSFVTDDGILIKGWYVPGETPQQAVILLHGYRQSRLQTLSRAELFRKQGYGALLYDARGCGESGGKRISAGYYETRDLLAAVRFLRQKGVKDIACVGISQGGATILMAAEQLQGICCVIVESAYSNIVDAVDNRFRLYLKISGKIGAALLIPFAEFLLELEAEQVSPLENITRLDCPVFLISGTADRKTLPQDTRRLYHAARTPKQLWMIEGAKHEDLYKFAPADYEQEVPGFVEKYMK
jgi:alpha-beta hydrolase superfamily lysophospholipase